MSKNVNISGQSNKMLIKVKHAPVHPKVLFVVRLTSLKQITSRSATINTTRRITAWNK